MIIKPKIDYQHFTLDNLDKGREYIVYRSPSPPFSYLLPIPRKDSFPYYNNVFCWEIPQDILDRDFEIVYGDENKKRK